MSVTGPGCEACDFKGVVPWASEPGMEGAFGVKPCDRCGGFSQFARPVVTSSPDRLAGDAIVEAMFAADPAYARTRPMHEDDWRPLPSVAEVIAHNARTGGDCFGPWLCVEDIDDEHGPARVVMLCVVSLDTGDEVSAEVGAVNFTRNPAARFRPITRRGGALPWPEVQR